MLVTNEVTTAEAGSNIRRWCNDVMAKYEKWLTAEGLLLIEGWARDGLTNEQIAEKMGISKSTLQEWAKKYSDFSDSLKKGKEVVDRQVENALLKRALGYEYEEVTQTLIEDEMRVSKIVRRHVPADVAAMAFWLKNRKPEEYRDKRDVTVEARKEATTPLVELVKAMRTEK